MTVYELSRDQLVELKQSYLEEYLDHWADKDETISYGDLMDADELIPDETIFELYEDTIFTDDDFFCSAK